MAVAEMTVVSPTNGRVDEKTASSVSDGVFYGVLKGIAETFSHRRNGYL